MKSIMQEDVCCYVCGCRNNLERHHAMSGTANRKLAERYGLTVYLCRDHHTGRIGVHQDIILKERIERDAQRAFEKVYNHKMWMNVFRKNYL